MSYTKGIYWAVVSQRLRNTGLEPSLKITGALPPLKLSPSMAQIETTLSYLNHLPKNISLNRSHPFWSYKGTFLYSSYCLHAHYMTHLFHLY